MRRSVSTRRKRKKGKRGPAGGALLLAAAAGGTGWLAYDRFATGEPFGAGLPLSTTAEAEAEPGEEPAAGADDARAAADGDAGSRAAPSRDPIEVDDPRRSVRSEPVPGELLTAFARIEDDVAALVDLRRLALDFGDRGEGARARRVLAKERERCLGEVSRAGRDPARVLELMTRVYVATLDAEARRALRPDLVELSDRVLFSDDGRLGTTTYEVRGGDSLSRIAAEHGTDYRFIKRLNGLESDAIRVGQRLRIPQRDVRLVIFKRDFELVALFGPVLLRAYDVATGKDDRTPEGSFTIAEKLVEPDWYSPDGEVYPYGTEENILGTRWLAFADTDEHQGYGIHGTKYPDSIGTQASMGCIRLRNRDVEVLFDLVPSGSRVRVVQ